MSIDELEAAVRVAWDREAIAIYADHLQTIGDPRGELVAIDLSISPRRLRTRSRRIPYIPAMRAWMIASVLLVMTGAAHAGKRTSTFDLVWWSTDGKSAMFTRNVQEDDKMGHVFGYVIVTASESKPLEITTTDTLADKPNQDAPADRIDVAACNKAGAALAKVIATKNFKGLKFEKNECTGTMRTVVHTPSILPGTKVPQYWIVDTGGSKVHNPPTKRETAALAAAATVTQEQALIAASPNDSTLVVIFYGGPQGLTFAYFNKGTLVAKDL